MNEASFTDMFFDFIIYNFSIKTNKTGNNVVKIGNIIKKILSDNSFEEMFIVMVTIRYKLNNNEQLTECEILRMQEYINISKIYEKEKQTLMCSNVSLKISNDAIKDPYDLNQYSKKMMDINYHEFANTIMKDN